MENPAIVSDVEFRWRPLSDQEIVNATTFLDDAWRMLRRRKDLDIEARLTDPDAEPGEVEELTAEVVRVLASSVVRVMKNPDGKRQESIDDYSWTRDQAVSAGLLYFTDDELAALAGDVPVIGNRAYSIDLAQRTTTGDGLGDRPDLWFQYRWSVL